MAEISLKTLRGLPAPGTYHRWMIDFPKLPAIGISNRDLTLRAISVNMPEMGHEKTTIEQAGFVAHWAGRNTFAGTDNLTFVDCIDAKTRNGFEIWMQMVWDTKDGTSFDKDDYTAIMQKHLLDHKHRVCRTYTYHGVFPENQADEGTLGSSVDARSLNMTFSYDYWE